MQFSVPFGTPDFVSAAVERLVDDTHPLNAAIAALPSGALQSQLLLQRFCAGPRANYWLRALPLVAGARLAAALDRDSVAAAVGLLTDNRDSPETRAALVERLPLPVGMGGLGIGGRARNVAAAALASRLDPLRAGRATSPALKALAVGVCGGLPAFILGVAVPAWVRAAMGLAASLLPRMGIVQEVLFDEEGRAFSQPPPFIPADPPPAASCSAPDAPAAAGGAFRRSPGERGKQNGAPRWAV